MCAKITVIVNDLKKKNPKIKMSTIKVGEGDSKEKIKEAKLKGHGIIARGSDGKLVATVDGHSYGEEKVEEVIEKLLAKAPAAK